MKKVRNTYTCTIQFRLILIYGCVLIWGIVLAGRFVQLQIIQGQGFAEKARKLKNGWDQVLARRGEILDRRLVQLAADVTVQELSADPQAIEDPRKVAAALSPIIDVNPAELVAALSRKSNYSRLKKEVSPAEAEAIRQLGIPGLHLRKGNARFYPKKTLASQVLGFVGDEGRGLSGLELYYESQIRGNETTIHFTFDGNRRSYRRAIPEDQSKGNILVLNIDQKIQYDAEEALKYQVKKSKAKSGVLVVMDPNSGELLAMASYPTYDPNHFENSAPENYRNRSILDTFEPGSIFKVVTLSAVLSEGLAKLDDVIDCRVGTLRLAGKVYREAKRSFGDLSVRETLAKSSNVGTIKLGMRLGPDRLYRYIKRFGFGDETGLDFPGEEKGRVRPVSEWSRISIGALCIGQEIAVTALQMLRAVSAIGNGGYLVQPHLVRQVLSPEGELLWQPELQVKRILQNQTTALMREAMAEVVEQGTGRQAQLAGYSSAGKTGTAQKFYNGTFKSGKYVASYVGFAPLDQPALAALVVIDEPRGSYYGGSVAAPLFKEVMEKALVHLRVPRDRPLKSAPALAVRELQVEPGVFEDGEPLSSGLLLETDDTLVESIPPFQNTEHVILLPEATVLIPNFHGLNLRQVAAQCADKDLTLRFSGSGIAIAQRPEPGRPVSRGAVCEVFFSNRGKPKGSIRNATGEVAFKNPAHFDQQSPR